MRLTGLSAESLTVRSIARAREQAAADDPGSLDDIDRELGITR